MRGTPGEDLQWLRQSTAGERGLRREDQTCRTDRGSRGVALLVAACQPPTLGPTPTLPSPGGSVGPNECAPVSASGVNYYGSLKYGHDNDFNQDLYLDALIPATSAGLLPAVVYVHGGGHVGGNKCEGQGAATYLAQHGFAVFSIDYPLATASQSAWYDQPSDTELAVQWLRTNAGTFGVNPSGIALWGTSAGADIAFDAALEAQRSDPAAKVQAVSGWSGSYDFAGEYYRNPESSAHIPNATEYLGCGDPLDDVCFDTIVGASPLTYASDDDPPAFIASSTDFTTGCESVEPQNSVEMVNAAQGPRGARGLRHDECLCARIGVLERQGQRTGLRHHDRQPGCLPLPAARSLAQPADHADSVAPAVERPNGGHGQLHLHATPGRWGDVHGERDVRARLQRTVVCRHLSTLRCDRGASRGGPDPRRRIRCRGQV